MCRRRKPPTVPHPMNQPHPRRHTEVKDALAQALPQQQQDEDEDEEGQARAPPPPAPVQLPDLGALLKTKV